MSSPYHKEEPRTTDSVDDLMIRDDDPEANSEAQNRTASSVRDIASRIPESLSAIGRDISRTIEKAISAKDDYVVAVKISPEAQDKLEQLVQALSLIHISEPTRQAEISYAVFCLKKKKKKVI